MHTTYRLAVLTHTRKRTFTHKVQVSASRTAIGAVLPIGFNLFSLCVAMSTFHIYVPRCNQLLSVQSVAGTVLSFHPPLRMIGRWRPSLSTLLSAAGAVLSSVMSLVLPLETQIIFPRIRDISWSADALLTSLRIQKEEAHFASQEVDMDLKYLCCWGYPPCSLSPRCTCWWGVFLKENAKKQSSRFRTFLF